MPRNYLKLAAILPAFLIFAGVDAPFTPPVMPAPAATAPSTAPAEIADTSYVRESKTEVDPDVVLIVATEDRHVAGDIQAFNEALKHANPKIENNIAYQILSAGPRLDSGDAVKIGKLVQKDNVLTLTITYTSGRVRGLAFKRNSPWTPLAFVQLPFNLPAGAYALKVTWQCSDEPAKGTAKPDDIVQETKFEMIVPK